MYFFQISRNIMDWDGCSEIAVRNAENAYNNSEITFLQHIILMDVQGIMFKESD